MPYNFIKSLLIRDFLGYFAKDLDYIPVCVCVCGDQTQLRKTKPTGGEDSYACSKGVQTRTG